MLLRLSSVRLTLFNKSGVHLDGYISHAAHTVVIPTEDNKPLVGKGADAVIAAYYGKLSFSLIIV
jgi:hypothetical protein